MQIKTIMRHHHPPGRMTTIQTQTTSNAAEQVEQQELASLLVGLNHGAATLEGNLVSSYKTKHILTV